MKGALDQAIMAAPVEMVGAKILKNTKIIVYVEEAMDELLVVSFAFGAKIFQGVLLDSNKKTNPFDVSASSMLLGSEKKSGEHETGKDGPGGGGVDRLYSVSQRHTYIQSGDQNESPNGQAPPRRPLKSFKDRTVRTMRLRPRQVLCSKCRSICNENSENVQHANTVKDSTNGLLSRIGDKNDNTVRLKPRTETIIAQEPTANSNNNPNNNSNSISSSAPVTALSSSSLPVNPVCESRTKSNRMILRKRPSIDSIQEEQDQDVEKKLRKGPLESTQEPRTLITKTSPVIKISFGPHGQGTVLKIPPRSHTYNKDEEASKMGTSTETTTAMSSTSSEASLQMTARDCSSAKAARKALKKAKKEAHRKASSLSSSPPLSFHHHKSRHHKHKFKHKRKHRDDETEVGPAKSADEHPCQKVAETTTNNNSVSVLSFPLDVGAGEQQPQPQKLNDDSSDKLLLDTTWNSEDSNKSDSYSEIKKECLRQKLSISLKRLNAKAYMRCNPSTYQHEGEEDSNSSGTSSGTSALTSNSDSNSDHGGEVPEFPESDLPHKVEKVKPLMMRISSHNVESCTLAAGKTMAVGDIVWGKIHGFPWWPGKVLSITVSQRDNGVLITQQAHVAWFGSSTSSYMPCSQLAPFLEYFKTRYNKKKRGPYKEAIKQATLAAQQVLRDMKDTTKNLLPNPSAELVTATTNNATTTTTTTTHSMFNTTQNVNTET